MNKKIINTKKINNFEVLTDDGWVNIVNIHTTIPYDIYILRTDNFELHCADNHIIFDIEYNEKFVKNLKIGDKIHTENGLETILEIQNTCNKTTMYDLEIDSNKHRYYTNGILSHNTCAAEILADDCDFIKINCSIDTGIEVVRTKINDHCKNFSLPFGKGKIKGNPKGQKLVWLEEFDKTSDEMRGALRGFIDEHIHVRFIITLNNLNKVNRSEEDKALLSRFTMICFDPLNKDEIVYLKSQQFLFLKSLIKILKFELEDKILSLLIDKTFPNFRSTIGLLQEIHISGDYNNYLEQKNSLNIDVFDFIMNKTSLNENHFFVMDNYPKEKTQDLLLILGRPFFKYLLEDHQDIILKNGRDILKLQKIYNAEYNNTLDPEIHLICFITELKELL